ncbi:MAG TPA: response regulator transcription factor [Gammaproteobacteria bacterium]|nr:response regulator transcription factor [Gammaproteobacteria bacterium]
MQILLADDHPLFLAGMRHILSQLDETVQVHCAEAGEAALQLLRGEIEFDLLLLDLGLPDTDGLGLLHILREEAIMVPVIVVSASENLHQIRAALAAGALGFIPKSHHAVQMLDAIHEVLDEGEIYLPDDIRAHIDRLVANDEIPASQGITSRQRQVLSLLAQGLANKQIAQRLNLTEHTVKAHLGALFQILKVSNRTECAQKAQRLGLLASDTPLN